jgi:hypothetical protein
MGNHFRPFTDVLREIEPGVTQKNAGRSKSSFARRVGVWQLTRKCCASKAYSSPTPNPNPTITIQNEPKFQPARSATLSDRCADCRLGFPHPPAGRQWQHLCKLFEELV